MENFAERARQNELEEYLGQSDKIAEGKNCEVLLSPRYEIVKLSKYDPIRFDEIKEMEKISGASGLPATWVKVEDLRDHDYWMNTVMQVQRYSDLPHNKAVEIYGVDKFTEMTSWMWTRLRRQDFIFEDLKPSNIGMFREGFTYIPKPVDFLDKDAYRYYEESVPVNPEREAFPFELYIQGNDKEDGIIDITDISIEDATEAIITGSNLMNDVDLTGDPLNDIREALKNE
ncbi:MAG: hypothetical protein ABEJ56_04265 [Candidatus Nanohaloarchaea archaeon]